MKDILVQGALKATLYVFPWKKVIFEFYPNSKFEYE